jgi:hypothetical protein
MTSRHVTSLTNGEIVEENDLGSIRLPAFPFTKVDPLIVDRSNPVDQKAMGE